MKATTTYSGKANGTIEERLTIHGLTENDLQLLVKSLTMASSTLQRFINDHGVNCTQEEIVRRLELISKFDDLNKKIQVI